jgi:hypothetical protein
MPCVGFEPTIPASEGAKTVHALDRASTVTGVYMIRPSQIRNECVPNVGKSLFSNFRYI